MKSSQVAYFSTCSSNRYGWRTRERQGAVSRDVVGVGRNQLALLVVVVLRDVVSGQRISRSKPIADDCYFSRLEIVLYMKSHESED
jgi:hypothetical protein